MGVENNDKIREYIDDVCSQIKFHEIHKDIGLELESHIKELAEEYIEEGLSDDDAVGKAITQMGDAFDVGKKLNRIHKPKPDWRLVVLTLIFTGGYIDLCKSHLCILFLCMCNWQMWK